MPQGLQGFGFVQCACESGRQWYISDALQTSRSESSHLASSLVIAKEDLHFKPLQCVLSSCSVSPSSHLLLVRMRRLRIHGLPQGGQQLVLCESLAAQARHLLHCRQQGRQLSNRQRLQNGILVCAGTVSPYHCPHMENESTETCS